MKSKGIAPGRVAGLCAGVVVAVLTGCAQEQPKPLYHWGDYQPELYSYFKATGDTQDVQRIKLETTVQQAQARNEALPPGFNAHLGLLYLKAGQADKARVAFKSEETQFPESKAYMDFLLNNMKPKTAPAAAEAPAASAAKLAAKPAAKAAAAKVTP